MSPRFIPKSLHDIPKITLALLCTPSVTLSCIQCHSVLYPVSLCPVSNVTLSSAQCHSVLFPMRLCCTQCYSVLYSLSLWPIPNVTQSCTQCPLALCPMPNSLVSNALYSVPNITQFCTQCHSVLYPMSLCSVLRCWAIYSLAIDSTWLVWVSVCKPIIPKSLPVTPCRWLS